MWHMQLEDLAVSAIAPEAWESSKIGVGLWYLPPGML